ncbi:MAG: DNA polymerase III subunit delta, partial [Pseudomonadales bacterium]|nr:DNA polymerase III subunit delta [Pseudomonadales bacterium]
MNITPDKLSQNLTSKINPVYLVTGEETLLIQESMDAIRQSCIKAGYDERVVFHVDTKTQWSAIIEECNALSLFAARKIVEIKLPAGKLNKDASEALCQYLSHPSEDAVILIESSKVDRGEQKKKWFKTIDERGLIVTVWPIDSQRLPAWLAKRLKQNGFDAERDALELLCQRVEGNLLAAAQEVEKLKLTCPNGKIAAEDVMAAVGDSARYSVFDLVDQCLSQNSKKAMHILETLKAEGVQPSITLWALSRQVRLISQLKASTGNTETILRKYTVPKNKSAQVSRLASALPNHFTDFTLRL